LEQFIAIAKGLTPQYLGINVDETTEDIAEEFATKLYQSNIKDVRQLINAIKI
jgi:predicted hydrocarbon binding protein